jgi:hypothetical protein
LIPTSNTWLAESAFEFKVKSCVVKQRSAVRQR